MKRKAPLILLCVVFLGIAGYFGFHFFSQLQHYQEGEESYDALTQHIHIEETTATAEETTASEEEPVVNWPTVDFESLKAINPDIVAWIYIEGTNINYPVVQGTDNSQYLNRLFDGTVNSAGSIFMDYRNENDFSDRNTVFYGHHMSNGTMFDQVAEYKDQAFYDSHPTCLILTPEKNYRVEFFAGYVTDMNSQAWKLKFGSDEEFSQWLEAALSQSTFSCNLTPTAQDRVVTLSTCTYEYNDARYVLLGILT